MPFRAPGLPICAPTLGPKLYRNWNQKCAVNGSGIGATLSRNWIQDGAEYVLGRDAPGLDPLHMNGLHVVSRHVLLPDPLHMNMLFLLPPCAISDIIDTYLQLGAWLKIAQSCTYNFDSRSVDHPPYCVPQLGIILEPILGSLLCTYGDQFWFTFGTPLGITFDVKHQGNKGFL